MIEPKLLVTKNFYAQSGQDLEEQMDEYFHEYENAKLKIHSVNYQVLYRQNDYYDHFALVVYEEIHSKSN